MKFSIINFAIVFLLLSHNVFSEPLKKIYIFKIKISNASNPLLEKKIRNSLIINIINLYKDKYSIIDEDSLLELSQKLKKLQLYGCSDEICIKEISNAIDADEFISGEIWIEKETYKVEFRNTLKNKETLETSIKSIVSESFYSFQLDYYLEEISKKLLNPNYKIDKKNAPLSSETSFEFAQFEWKDSGKLPPITSKTKLDQKLEVLQETLKSYLTKADMLFENKEHENSLQSYKAILDTILETIRPEEQQKLTEFVSLLKERIRVIRSILLGKKLTELEQEFLEANKNSNYTKILNEYLDFLNEYQKLKEYEKTLNLELAARQRIIYMYEKQAEIFYKNLEFTSSLSLYQKALSYSTLKELKNKREALQTNITTVTKSGTNFLENFVKANCDEADILNTKYEIEYKSSKSSETREYKYKAISILEKTSELMEKEKSFLSASTMQYYDQTVQNINRDSGEILLTPSNILLFPFRYVGNLIKGIADIFVFKLGWGLGGGAELGIAGGGGLVGYFPLEFSTAYPKEHSSLQEVTVKTNKNFLNLKEKNTYYGFAYVYFGTCGNLLLRICENPKYYTSGNAWIGAGPAVYVGVEFHRAVEYLGVIFFQDWNVLGYPTERFQYFSYKKLEPIRKKLKTKFNPPLFYNF